MMKNFNLDIHAGNDNRLFTELDRKLKINN